MSLQKVASGDESCIDTRAQSPLEKRTDKKSQRKFNVNSTLAFFMLKLANPSVFFVPSKMTGAIIYCTLYCIKYVTDVTVHLYINILFNMLYMCIQQTQTV